VHARLVKVETRGTGRPMTAQASASARRFAISPTEKNRMNEDRIKGKWKQVKGTIQEKWGKLTNDDLDVAEGNTEYLAGKIQERYGMARDDAEKAAKEFERSL
jgi:uncharacterized protein YjbJ (UPF0337 family)